MIVEDYKNRGQRELLPTLRAENLKYEPDQTADIINRLISWFNSGGSSDISEEALRKALEGIEIAEGKLDANTTFWGQIAKNGKVSGAVNFTDNVRVSSSGGDLVLTAVGGDVWVMTGDKTFIISPANLNVGNRQVKGVANPTDPQDAVNKSYLDDITANINTRIDGLDSDITGLNNSLAAARGSIEQNAKDIADLQDGLDDVRGDVAGVKGDISDIRGDITNIQGNVANIQGDVTNIQSTVTTIQGNVTKNQNDIKSINTSITTINASIDDIYSKLNSATGAQQIYYGTSAPSSTLGKTDNLYVRYDVNNHIVGLYRKGSVTGWTLLTIGSEAIADDAITSSKIASSAVTSAKIGSGAVTSAKLGSGAVTPEKVSWQSFGDQSSYMYFGNVLIQWGYLNSTGQRTTIRFPQRFGGTNYSLHLTAGFASTTREFFVFEYSRAVGSAEVECGYFERDGSGSGAMAGIAIHYFAIGPVL